MNQKEKLQETTIKALQGILVETINKGFFNGGSGTPGYEIQVCVNNELYFNRLSMFTSKCYKCQNGYNYWKISGNNLVFNASICEHEASDLDYIDIANQIERFYKDVCSELDGIINRYDCYEIESIIFNFRYYTEKGFEKVQKIFKPTSKDDVNSRLKTNQDNVDIHIYEPRKDYICYLDDFGKSINISDVNGNVLHIGDIVKYRNKLCVIRNNNDKPILTEIGKYRNNYASSSISKSELYMVYTSACLFNLKGDMTYLEFISGNSKRCVEICNKYDINVTRSEDNYFKTQFTFGDLEQYNKGYNMLRLSIDDETNKKANILGLLNDYNLI